jgi:hypothetical protein
MKVSPPLDGRIEVFDKVFMDRIWRHIPCSLKKGTNPNPLQIAAHLFLQKGMRQLHFDPSKRLLIALLAPVHPGKKLQVKLFQRALGLQHYSIQNLISDKNDESEQTTLDMNSIEMTNIMIKDDLTQPGVILSGCLSNETQRKWFVDFFSRDRDVILPIYLDIQTDNNYSLPRAEEESQRKKITQEALNDIDKNRIAHKCITLQVKSTSSVEEVFHSIFEKVQERLDSVCDTESQLVLSENIRPLLSGSDQQSSGLEELSLGKPSQSESRESSSAIIDIKECQKLVDQDERQRLIPHQGGKGNFSSSCCSCCDCTVQ